MNSDAFVRKYALCASCGPDARKCLGRNAACRNPRVYVNEKAYEKVERAWMMAKRRTKRTDREFIFNYFDYHGYFFYDD